MELGTDSLISWGAGAQAGETAKCTLWLFGVFL